MITALTGDCRDTLPMLPDESVRTIVTSPPYWRLRRYLPEGHPDAAREIGQELTCGEYVAALVQVFQECWRVLRPDGTLWLNLGDAYADDSKWGGTTGVLPAGGLHGKDGPGRRKVATGLPPKNLIGIPWRVAFALQDAGWILRSDIIWHKPNAMPESVTDRPTRAHEYLFLFSKSVRYYYDAAAIAEAAQEHHGSAASFRRSGNKRSEPIVPGAPATHRPDRPDVQYSGGTRNARSVWSIPTQPLADAHYAPMPVTLAERCILAGSRVGDTVLDPFGGSGTTGRAALKHQRTAILCELNQEYVSIQERRTNGVQVVADLWGGDNDHTHTD